MPFPFMQKWSEKANYSSTTLKKVAYNMAL